MALAVYVARRYAKNVQVRLTNGYIGSAMTDYPNGTREVTLKEQPPLQVIIKEQAPPQVLNDE
jgi:hypothetical protein